MYIIIRNLYQDKGQRLAMNMTGTDLIQKIDVNTLKPARIQFTCPLCDFPFDHVLDSHEIPSIEIVHNIISLTLDQHSNECIYCISASPSSRS